MYRVRLTTLDQKVCADIGCIECGEPAEKFLHYAISNFGTVSKTPRIADTDYTLGANERITIHIKCFDEFYKNSLTKDALLHELSHNLSLDVAHHSAGQ